MRYQIEKSMGMLSVSTPDGSTVAELAKAFWSERATVTIEGRPWDFGKEPGGIRTAVSHSDPNVSFSASRVGFWRGVWELRCGGTTYSLKPVGFSQSTYEISRDGSAIGTSGRGSFWSNKPYVEVPEEVPVPHAVFLLWIAFIMRSRANAAAANAS